jgi:DeoR family transcriptional regulator of aga operon
MAGSIHDQIHADFVFIGCNGIGEAHGVTDINLQEAQIKTRMVQPERRTVVVVDGARVGKTSVARIARIDEVDHLVTTASPMRMSWHRSKDSALT